MSEANKIAVVAFYKQALMEGDVENAFKLYAEHSGNFVLDGVSRMRASYGCSGFTAGLPADRLYQCP